MTPDSRNLPPIPGSDAERWRVIAAAVLIVAGGLAAYFNSLSGPFLFDDLAAVVENPTIRRLWPPGDVLSPPLTGGGVVGRPLLNLTFAINHAGGGLDPRGYHAVNLLLHLLAGLALFGVARRTLARADGRRGADPLVPAAAGTLLWTVHPLLTESVDAVVNRSELLVALCYLLTLYGFLRSLESPAAWRWRAASAAACLLGMASKEVMVSAPLAVLVYDRTFEAGSFGEASRRRRGYYLGLAATWILLAWLVWGGRGRNATVGFGLGISAWSYALTQCRAVVDYLGLALWPHPLVFDYGTEVAGSVGEVLPQAALLGALAAAAVYGLVRRSLAGFAGVCFLAVLAPSSSVLPLTTQTAAEHRMYLPLAALALAGAGALRACLGRRSVPVFAALAGGLALLTIARNGDYRSEVRMWTDTVAKRPGNARARYNLGLALSREQRLSEAEACYREACRLKADYAEARNNLGNAISHQGRPAEAIPEYEKALQLRPGYPAAHYNLATALAELGRPAEALPHFEAAAGDATLPDPAGIRCDFGEALVRAGRPAEAAAQFEEALRAGPPTARAHVNLGATLARLGRPEEAARHYEAALRIDPASADAHYNLGSLSLSSGRDAEAVAHFEQAVRIRPDFGWAEGNLAYALARLGRAEQAAGHYEAALRLVPSSAEIHKRLAAVLEELGRPEEAAAHYAEALRLKPGDAGAEAGLARARAARAVGG